MLPYRCCGVLVRPTKQPSNQPPPPCGSGVYNEPRFGERDKQYRSYIGSACLAQHPTTGKGEKLCVQKRKGGKGTEHRRKKKIPDRGKNSLGLLLVHFYFDSAIVLATAGCHTKIRREFSFAPAYLLLPASATLPLPATLLRYSSSIQQKETQTLITTRQGNTPSAWRLAGRPPPTRRR